MVENIPKEMKLECIFCHATDFVLPHKNYVPEESKAVKCANCGELNDFSSLKKVAIENVNVKVIKEIKQQFKNLFK